MVYDTALADEVRAAIGAEPGMGEKAMFGGLAFLVHGNMAVAASGRGGLLVRVDPARVPSLIREAGVEPMVMRGRAMVGWLHVGTEALSDDESISRWVARGIGFARDLPPKR